MTATAAAPRNDRAVVSCCGTCGGWLGVMTEDAEQRSTQLAREFYAEVATYRLTVRRISGDAFRRGEIPACECVR